MTDPYRTVITRGDLDDAAQKRALVALDRLEALGMKLAAERDDAFARISSAALLGRLTIAAGTAALDAYDHTQSHAVHDLIVEMLSHLRTAQRVLAGTQPEREAPTRNRSKH